MKNLFFCMLALSLMSSASALAAGSDELWEVTTKIKSEIPGKPVMPAMTSKKCMKKRHEDPNSEVKQHKNCKTIFKGSGNKWSAQTKCNGEYPTTASSEGTEGDGTYSIKTKMHTKDGDWTQFEEGKRIGTCNYETDGAKVTDENADESQDSASDQKSADDKKPAGDKKTIATRTGRPIISWTPPRV